MSMTDDFFCRRPVPKSWLLPVLLFTAAPALAQTLPPAPAPTRTVLVRGRAEREIDPERLDVLLTYRFSDNVKDGERTQSQEEALRQVLRRASIGEDKLVLENLSASGYGGLSKVGNASVALTKTYRLTLDNPRQLNTLVPQLVQTGADNLRFVNLQSSREAATKAELTTQACADARQKANLAAKATGSRLGPVLTLVEVIPGVPYATETLEAYYKAKPVERQMRLGEITEIDTPTLRKIKLVVLYDVVFEVTP